MLRFCVALVPVYLCREMCGFSTAVHSKCGVREEWGEVRPCFLGEGVGATAVIIQEATLAVHYDTAHLYGVSPSGMPLGNWASIASKMRAIRLSGLGWVLKNSG